MNVYDRAHKTKHWFFRRKLPKAAALLCALALLVASAVVALGQSAPTEYLKTTSEPGRPGGRIVTAQRAEPKTLNPVVNLDQPSRDVSRRMNADLIHINRYTQKTEPALAKSWSVSPDGKSYTLRLRRGVLFSDGQPFNADDVVFTFGVYLNENVHSPQRDLLIIAGKPITITKIDNYTVRFTLPQPYAAAERIFDSLAILPQHLLRAAYEDGKIAQAWGLNTAPDKIAGLGPFRFKQYVPGERIILERNPYYWKIDSKGQKLPYLDELEFLFVPSEDAQAIRFQSGDTDVIDRVNAGNFAALAREQKTRNYSVYDAGPSLEYNFLVLNLNDDTTGRLPEIARKQKWFNDLRFRQAISSAIDRAAIVRLVFQGRGVPLTTPVTPGNKLWLNAALAPPQRSLPHARELLQSAGFSWRDNTLVDQSGQTVEFSIITSSSNAQRTQMATIIQDDLKQLGMNVQVVPMEFRSALDRIFESHDYEAAVLGLGSGDVDPTSDMNVWMSNGQTHVWHLGQKTPATPWEAEIDRLMQQQMVTTDYKQRKRIYDRVQEIIAQQLPVIFLASPNMLVGARNELGNFHPAIMDHYTLWNVDELYWRTPRK
ncbi:MAG TPA: ABC transporter substrate-binding protein [Terriglobales bacterium]